MAATLAIFIEFACLFLIIFDSKFSGLKAKELQK